MIITCPVSGMAIKCVAMLAKVSPAATASFSNCCDNVGCVTVRAFGPRCLISRADWREPEVPGDGATEVGIGVAVGRFEGGAFFIVKVFELHKQYGNRLGH